MGSGTKGTETKEISKAWKKAALLALAAPVLLVAAGCKKGQVAKVVKPPVANSQIDMSTAGTVEGTIHYAKKAPARIAIDMDQDPACALSTEGPNLTEEYVVNDGGMANVFVYVKDGLGNKIYPSPSTPVVLDQKGCRYVPHVIGVMVGQPVEFRTQDPTMHNINVQPSVAGDAPFDVSQAPNGPPVRRVFAKPETMVPVRCNNHPWMQAYINIAPNPFFAVSDEKGHFVIHGLPPGTYTLVAQQEKLGPMEQTITVAPQKTTTADFTFGK